jgi:hypothetical protein
MKDALFICELGNTLKTLPYTDKIFSYLNRTRAHDILNGKNWQDMTNKGLFTIHKRIKQQHQNLPNVNDVFYSTDVTTLIKYLRDILQHFQDYNKFLNGATDMGMAADVILEPFSTLIAICFLYVQEHLSGDKRFDFFLSAST